MRPTEILMSEHRGIEKMLEVVKATATRLAAGEPIDLGIFDQAIDFFSNFADQCHHGKEERYLFARLVAKGLPRDGGPVAVMLAEHELGRGHIRGMREALALAKAGDETGVKDLADHALAYVELLSAHIKKEDGVLFPYADRALLPAEQAELERAFEKVEAEEMGEGVHERYHRMIHTLQELVLAL